MTCQLWDDLSSAHQYTVPSLFQYREQSHHGNRTLPALFVAIVYGRECFCRNCELFIAWWAHSQTIKIVTLCRLDFHVVPVFRAMFPEHRRPLPVQQELPVLR